MSALIRWVANVSVLFTEVELLDRPAEAATEGFTEIELWWPFGANPEPAPADVDAFVAAVRHSGVQVTAMNLFGGPPGMRGVLSHPQRSTQFKASVVVAAAVAERLGIGLFNAPYGERVPGLPDDLSRQTAVANLAYAAEVLAAIGGTVMVEPLSRASADAPSYPIQTAAEAAALIDEVADRAGANGIGLLLDQYHLMVNGADVIADITRFRERIRHVQIADVPGRGEPGSGQADLAGVLEALGAVGYRGGVALEYIPRAGTRDSLVTWRRALARSGQSPSQALR